MKIENVAIQLNISMEQLQLPIKKKTIFLITQVAIYFVDYFI